MATSFDAKGATTTGTGYPGLRLQPGALPSDLARPLRYGMDAFGGIYPGGLSPPLAVHSGATAADSHRLPRSSANDSTSGRRDIQPVAHVPLYRRWCGFCKSYRTAFERRNGRVILNAACVLRLRKNRTTASLTAQSPVWSPVQRPCTHHTRMAVVSQRVEKEIQYRRQPLRRGACLIPTPRSSS